MGEFAVFRLDSTTSDTDRGRPEIDLTDPRNQGPSWQRLREIWLGEKPVESYLPIEVHVDSPNVESFHGYWGGMSRFFSEKVACVLEQLCPGHVQFLPVFVNGHRFFSIYMKTITDALDKQKSDIKMGKALPVRLFAFDFAKLHDPFVFSIPEEREIIFVTETLAEALEKLNLRGIEIFDASGLPRWHIQWKHRSVKDVRAARISTLRSP